MPLLLALALGCAAPEAPDRVEDMIVYGFEHFDSDDPRYLTALADKLIPWMDNNIEGITEGYAVHDLTEAHLAAVGLDVEVEDAVVGALTGVEFSVPPGTLAEAYVYAQQDEIFTSYLSFERESIEGADCFLSQTCSRYAATDEVLTDLGVLGIELENRYDTAFRWVEMDDGTVVVAHRNLGPSPVNFSVEFLAVHQQYSFSMAYQRPDGTTRRAWAIWADGEVIGADLPETWQITQGVNAMHKAAGDIEAWLTGVPPEE